MVGNLDLIKAAERRGRATVRRAANRALSTLVANKTVPQARFDPAEVRRILVVRLNGRMGNTLFLTPLLSALHEMMPHAEIDVFVNYPDAADLLRGLPGLHRVMSLPHKGWWRFGQSLATYRAFRATRYDLAIDPQANSSGGRIALLVARTRWRLGFGGEQQWLRLDHAARIPPGVPHEALRPLALLQQAFPGSLATAAPRLCVANSADELAAGARLLAERTGGASAQPRPRAPIIGFFGSARGRKNLGPHWWREFWRAYLDLRPGTVPIEVLPGADHPPVMADIATVHCSSPRQLAATIAHADWFFSADTGPMHLASAAGVPTIAFFDHSNPDKYGPIKLNDHALRIAGMTPQLVAAACANIVAAKSSDEFAPQ